MSLCAPSCCQWSITERKKRKGIRQISGRNVGCERAKALAMVTRAAEVMAPILGPYDPAEIFDFGISITPAVLLCALESAAQVEVVERAYKSEYLEFKPSQAAGNIYRGRSFFAVVGSSSEDWIDYFCMMVRLKCAWYTTRRNRRALLSRRRIRRGCWSRNGDSRCCCLP